MLKLSRLSGVYMLIQIIWRDLYKLQSFIVNETGRDECLIIKSKSYENAH